MRHLAILALLFLAGCCPLDIAPAKALMEAVEPEHMAYVNADETLTAEQKNRRARTWEAFRIWIEAAEEDEKILDEVTK